MVAIVGQTHVVRSLNTRDSATARAQRWRAIGKLHEEFASLKSGADRVGDATSAAVAERRQGRFPLCHTRPSLKAPPSREQGGAPEHAPKAAKEVVAARTLCADARARTGRTEKPAVPEPETLVLLSEAWLREVAPTVTKQTVSQHRVALRELFDFVGNAAAVGDVERRMAGRFITERLLNSGRSRKTVNRLISSLSSFWSWLVKRGHGDANPWHGQFMKPQRGAPKPKRPYRDEELLRLLRTDPVPSLGQGSGGAIADLMRLALMTGARLNELCELRVEDVVGDAEAILIRDGKTVNARRVLPLHASIAPVIERRVRQAVDGQLFSELKPGGPDLKRSWYISKRFTEYRRRVLGPDDSVDFHSFRRSFATFLERASMSTPEVNASVIAELMGHAKPTLALALYSGGLTQTHLAKAIDALGVTIGEGLISAIVEPAVRGMLASGRDASTSRCCRRLLRHLSAEDVAAGHEGRAR